MSKRPPFAKGRKADGDRIPVKAHSRGRRPPPPPPQASMLANPPGGDNANFPPAGAPGNDGDADDFGGGM